MLYMTAYSIAEDILFMERRYLALGNSDGKNLKQEAISYFLMFFFF